MVLQFSVDEIPVLHCSDPHVGQDMSVLLTIKDSIFDAECRLGYFDLTVLEPLLNRIRDVVTSTVDMYIFSTGTLFTVLIEALVDDTGCHKDLVTKIDYVKDVCTLTDPLSMANIVLGDARIFLAMRDLINGATCTNTAL